MLDKVWPFRPNNESCGSEQPLINNGNIIFVAAWTRPLYSWVFVRALTCKMTYSTINFEDSAEKKKQKKNKNNNHNSYQSEQKNKENGLLLVELNDHWFPLKVRRWNERTDCEMLHLVSKVDAVQRTELISLYVCVFLKVPAIAIRSRSSPPP